MDYELVKQKFSELADTIYEQTGRATAEQTAQGFLQIAIANMANAVKKISIERGYDVSKYTLVSFGGAGGQHACLVADALGMQKVLIHPFAGVLSAYGMGLADITAMRETAVELPLEDESMPAAEESLNTLIDECSQELLAQGVSTEQTEITTCSCVTKVPTLLLWTLPILRRCAKHFMQPIYSVIASMRDRPPLSKPFRLKPLVKAV